VVIEIIPPLVSFGIRFAVSGTVLLVAYYLSHRGQNHHEHIGKHEWKDVLILGVSIILGGRGLLVWGAQNLSSGITSLLISTIPLWIAIFAALVFRKHLKSRM
jgi:drug/metabolite transporter (DMT)-like permease